MEDEDLLAEDKDFVIRISDVSHASVRDNVFGFSIKAGYRGHVHRDDAQQNLNVVDMMPEHTQALLSAA
jgi:hypothetical protein